MIRHPLNAVSRNILRQHVEKLRQLADDLSALIDGVVPGEAQLAQAPLLEEYALDIRPEPNLVGLCYEHPNLHGPVIKTSGLWVYSTTGNWARTYSRWYRIGPPRPDRSS